MKTSLQRLVFCLSILCCSYAIAETTNLIRIKGSDTMVNVAQSWAEAYENTHRSSNVAISVGGGGSGTGLDSQRQRSVHHQTAWICPGSSCGM